ncbi:hypothetical protein AGRA3207_002490 [Actinomadura graeca]|uniref:Secreted protein n=1 Tax=Actinomadura graeca TaxID=2750812 RepID=A0ABX8QTU7_9ACTN|nr:hypothetical protein [Actinomadura graeca]QXJ21619.1 hypothetical protein AGRA3207_002490 [Actinomadura graeca]
MHLRVPLATAGKQTTRRTRKAAMRVTGVVLAAAAVPLIAAAPAHANVAHCQAYLRSQGYTVGPRSTHACTWAANPNNGPARGAQCRDMLIHIGVGQYHAIAACREAFK